MIDRDSLPDLGPVLESPFESASNVSFDLLLVAGVALLAVVAVAGRSPVTAALVVAYLLAIPAYVAVRVRAWEGETADGEEDEAGNEDETGDEGGDESRDEEGNGT